MADIGSFFTNAASGAAGGSFLGLPGAAAGALISGVSSLIGGSASNAANEQMQSRQFVDNAELQVQAQNYNTEQANTAWQRSQQQMAQQEQYNTNMANSAYQRSVADEKAAGLNPIMGIAQGGASTPGLNITAPASPTSGASSVGMPTMQNVIGPAVASALQGAKLAGDLQQTYLQNDNLAKQSDLISAQADKTKNESEGAAWDAIKKRFEIPLTKSQTNSAQAAADKMAAETDAQRQSTSGKASYGTGFPGDIAATLGTLGANALGNPSALNNYGGASGPFRFASPNFRVQEITHY